MAEFSQTYRKDLEDGKVVFPEEDKDKKEGDRGNRGDKKEKPEKKEEKPQKSDKAAKGPEKKPLDKEQQA